MRVVRFELRDFRNYQRVELELGPGLTVIAGSNGAGKTNLLEGLYFGLTGRSCRTSNEREVVRHGARLTRAAITTVGDGVEHLLEVGFEPGETKRLRLDGAEPDSASAVEARPLVSVFLPERLELVKGPPAHRRAHLDRFVAALWPARAGARSAYGRALAQRNALLARVRAGAAAADQLAPWEAELARHGIALMTDRRGAAEMLGAPYSRRAAELGLPAALRYRPRSQATTVEDLAAELAERREQDLARGFTGHGPHRDELVLEHAGRGLRSFGSQGQQRVGVLALLFAERDVLMEHARPPLMLLDDVMSELDPERRERLTELLRAGTQAVVTTTDPDHVPVARYPDTVLVTVADGSLSYAPGAVAA